MLGDADFYQNYFDLNEKITILTFFGQKSMVRRFEPIRWCLNVFSDRDTK